jgi:pyruvate/2-oxoacid:ferredoxin oxidoreductase alpha subunit
MKVGLFRPITLWPFPERELARMSRQLHGILTVELSSGQMIEDVRLAVEGRCPVAFHGRMGGLVPTPDEVLGALKALRGRVERTRAASGHSPAAHDRGTPSTNGAGLDAGARPGGRG